MPEYSWGYSNRSFLIRKEKLLKAKAKVKLKFPHLEIGSRQYENVLASYMRK